MTQAGFAQSFLRAAGAFGHGLVTVAAVALVLLPVAEAAEPKPILLAAANVPLPRLKPGAAAIVVESQDPIGAFIGGDDDDAANPIAEDNDGPEAAGPPAETEIAPPPTAKAPPSTQTKVGAAGFRMALDLLDKGDPAAATLAAYAIPDKIDIRIIDWLVATGGYASVPSARIADVMNRLGGWPGQALMRIRYEQALVREKPKAATVIKILGSKTPATTDGVMLLARAYLDSGRKGDATTLIRTWWRTQKFDSDLEAKLRKEFGSLLSTADHKARMDRLLYDEQSDAALREAATLSKDEKALATAVVAVIRNKKAEKALAEVPKAKQSDPLYLYSRIQILRRAEKVAEAARLMLSAPRDPKVLVDADAWWVERRLISRALIEKGDARTAYKLAATHSAESSALRAEAEFHAGWYALEFLRDPATARKHFLAIQANSSLPLTRSRAEYWLGRAAVAAGDMSEATAQFRLAAAFPTTFYGQLALSRLGVKKLPLKFPPPADEALKAKFAGRELVQVIIRLTANNHDDRVDIFYRTLADTLDDPAEIVLLAAMAEADGKHQIALQVGKTAASRGLPVDSVAFPTAAIPAAAKTAPVDKSVVYAIARQESAFNHGAISRAGARGLLQLMPATAKETAKKLGLPYSRDRLTADPAYNATLGAAHLNVLLEDFGGSYVMTFASYNAGGSRVRAWSKAHGDPRDPATDVVNWIELIPFTETRNYVQRIMENLQVYRARLGSAPLAIEKDLKRGKMVATD